MRKPAKPSKPTREWRITLIRKRGYYVGMVEAPDAATAIAKAAEVFQLSETQRARLIALPVE